MVVIGVIVLVGALLATGFRTLALGPAAERLTAWRVWQLDVGTRYGWLAFGLAVLVLVALRGAPLPSFLTLTAYWLIGLAAIWFIPPYLSSLF